MPARFIRSADMLGVIKKTFIGHGFNKKHPEPDAENDMNDDRYDEDPF